MGSVAEAEIGATYIIGQEAVPIRTLLLELGHPQPATPIQVYDSTANGFAKAKVSSSSTGIQASLTLATTTLSIIQRPTTS